MKFLDHIDSPGDLKKLDIDQLPQLTEEIREFLIDSISKTGGHFSSNLGVVELSVALHYTLNTPKDILVWDVGHQGYVHKILTGRKKQFHTVRKYEGISGFLRREESGYDTFGAGHAGTSISAALGFAKARDMAGEDHRVVAIIGDGSMTAGMAFEALNNAGDLNTNITVILNDNKWSIAPNVGFIPRYLNKIISAPLYNKFREDVQQLVGKIPTVGPKALNLARRVEEGLKNLIVPDMLFEEMGFRYFGPIDGHDVKGLAKELNNIKDIKGPKLLHVITQKGKGYKPAEEDPWKSHGAVPFDKEAMKPLKKSSAVSYTHIFADTLIELAKKNPKIIGITAAMPDGTGLNKFQQAHPDRYFDVGIAEQHAVTFAGGLAASGKYHPVCAIYSTFLQRAYDQVLHDVCIQNLPVVFAMDRGGVVGADGPTHQGLFDIAYLRTVPNITLMAPKDGAELQQMLATAFTVNGPSAIRYPRGSAGGFQFNPDPETVPVGKAETVCEGEEVAVIALGTRVEAAELAATDLQSEGIFPVVVNPRFIKPLDKEYFLDLFRKVKKVVTVEDHALMGGFGSAVLEFIAENNLRGMEVKRLGFPDHFIEHGDQAIMYEKYKIDRKAIVDAVKSFASLKKPGTSNKAAVVDF